MRTSDERWTRCSCKGGAFFMTPFPTGHSETLRDVFNDVSRYICTISLSLNRLSPWILDHHDRGISPRSLVSCAQLLPVSTPGLSRCGFTLKGGITSVRSWLRDSLTHTQTWCWGRVWMKSFIIRPRGLWESLTVCSFYSKLLSKKKHPAKKIPWLKK